MTDGPKIAVVGSGVIGLTSALRLAQEFNGAQVTIISDQNLQDQTSWGPPGLFGCYITEEIPESRQWMRDGYDGLMEIYKSSEAIEAGVQLISRYYQEANYDFLKDNYEKCKEIFPDVRWLTEGELNLVNNPKPYGLFMTTFTTEGRKFTPYLAKNGVGARQLANDPKVQPLRGVFIEVHAPWVNHVFYHDYDKVHGPTVVIPGMDRVFLGTVRQIGRYDRQITQIDRDDIWQRVLNMMPNLKHATVLDEWCGIRPHRDIPRVEFEVIRKPNTKPLKVIHNYGHSSIGFTLSLGCANHVKKLINENLRYSKL